jgi:hypothetical protein
VTRGVRLPDAEFGEWTSWQSIFVPAGQWYAAPLGELCLCAMGWYQWRIENFLAFAARTTHLVVVEYL